MLFDSFGPKRNLELRVSFFGLRGFGQQFDINGLFSYRVNGLFGFGVIGQGFRNPTGGVLTKKFEKSGRLDAFEHFGPALIIYTFLIGT